MRTQIQYVKHMNLNTIRLEGFWGNNQDIYDLCDKYGILIMVGWSCHWEWDEYLGKACGDFSGIQTESDITLALNSFRDQLLWLRNLLCSCLDGWKRQMPKPELPKSVMQILSKVLTTGLTWFRQEPHKYRERTIRCKNERALRIRFSQLLVY
ncbi:MAG: hypothetical protein U0Z17_05750 [Bacteroidales bacterium]